MGNDRKTLKIKRFSENFEEIFQFYHSK